MEDGAERQLANIGKGMVQLSLRLNRLLEIAESGGKERAGDPQALDLLFDLLEAVDLTLQQAALQKAAFEQVLREAREAEAREAEAREVAAREAADRAFAARESGPDRGAPSVQTAPTFLDRLLGRAPPPGTPASPRQAPSPTSSSPTSSSPTPSSPAPSFAQTPSPPTPSSPTPSSQTSAPSSPISPPPPDLQGLLLARARILERLRSAAILPVPGEGPVDVRLQRVVETIPTADRARDGHISRSHSAGWYRPGDPPFPVRTALVSVWKWEPNATQPPEA